VPAVTKGKIVTRESKKLLFLVPLGALRRARTDGFNLYGDHRLAGQVKSREDHDTLRVYLALNRRV
jgi:hypothetical protein